MNEFEIKKKRLFEFAYSNNFDGVILGTNANFSWISCGKNAFVDKGSENSVAKLLFLRDKVYLICNSSEMFRIPEEELCKEKYNYELISYDWNNSEDTIIKSLIDVYKVASDFYCKYAINKSNEIKELRYSLTDEEVDRYKEIGREVTEICESCCKYVRSGFSEVDVETLVCSRLIAKGYTIPVCLIGSDDRLKKYRHPIPKLKKIEDIFMVAVCVQKYGITVSLSRIVSFKKLSDDILKRFNAVIEIDANYIKGTTSGRSTDDIIKDGLEIYKKHKYENDFLLHHQGGAIGYLTRDYCATGQSGEVVNNRQAFSWNPTISKVKSEDTFIVFGNNQEILTLSNSWPQVKVETKYGNIYRPDILIS